MRTVCEMYSHLHEMFCAYGFPKKTFFIYFYPQHKIKITQFIVNFWTV